MILFVGINNKNGLEPLDPSTRTGEIVNRICEQIPNKVLKTNLCNFEIEGKRPTEDEINNGLEYLKMVIEKLNPSVMLCLGNLVYSRLKDYKNAVKIKHPSYIWVYKRKELDNYIKETVKTITEV